MLPSPHHGHYPLYSKIQSTTYNPGSPLEGCAFTLATHCGLRFDRTAKHAQSKDIFYSELNFACNCTYRRWGALRSGPSAFLQRVAGSRPSLPCGFYSHKSSMQVAFKSADVRVHVKDPSWQCISSVPHPRVPHTNVCLARSKEGQQVRPLP